MFNSTDYFKTLFDYNRWANRRVWDCVAKLSEEQYHQPCDYSVGSVHQQMRHVMAIEASGLYHFMGRRLAEDDPDRIREEDFTTREGVGQRWERLAQEWADFVGGLSEDDLAQPIHINKEKSASLADNLMSVINHGTNHRAQTLRLIADLGGETCEQGFWFYMQERE